MRNASDELKGQKRLQISVRQRCTVGYTSKFDNLCCRRGELHANYLAEIGSSVRGRCRQTGILQASALASAYEVGKS